MHDGRKLVHLLCKRQSYPELVRSELVDVGSWTRDGFVPETELQQQLVPTRQQHLPPLVPVVHELLQQRQNKRNVSVKNSICKNITTLVR